MGRGSPNTAAHGVWWLSMQLGILLYMRSRSGSTHVLQCISSTSREELVVLATAAFHAKHNEAMCTTRQTKAACRLKKMDFVSSFPLVSERAVMYSVGSYMISSFG